MTCNKSTMLRTAIGFTIVLAVAYVLLPAFRSWIVSALPILLLLICPLSMLFMSGMQRDSDTHGKTDKASRDGESWRDTR
ncbi:MAG: DUF2933 domain-containing protein [Pseudogulbenkiania sp.]|nr:DUF2933 domain-containing protein [Pseudogulbenkiania sp.]